MLDPVIHQEARLRIVALLHRNGEASFKRLGDELSLTPGNLGAHVSKLEEAAYVRERQALTAAGFERRFLLTSAGAEAFRAYLARLQEILADATRMDAA